jgi:hypothetical protein
LPAPPAATPGEVRSSPFAPPQEETLNDPSQVEHRTQIVYLAHTPRVGELSPGWRIITMLTWLAVILAFSAVWNASVQLGLSTWWLGPRGQPRPLVVQLTPFVAPVLIVLGTINHVRWLGWWGLAASAVLAAYGIADLGNVTSIAALELLIAGLAAASSIASLTGTYRVDPAASSHPGD